MASEDIYAWSTTASDNASADAAINWSEGQTPGSLNGSARAMMAALARFVKDNNGTLSTAGASNIYTIASPNINYGAHATGITITAKASFSNTATATLNVNNLGAKPIRVFGPSGEVALAAGQIQQNGFYKFIYDAAAASAAGAWILLNPTDDATVTAQVGAIVPYGGSAAPSGWLLCYGQAVSRTTYAALYAVIGTTFGAGDGSTTFNLPDLRGRAPFGRDDMGGSAASRITNAGSSIVGTTLGATGGAESVTLTTNQTPSHTHTGTTSSNGAHTHGGATGSDGSHNHGGATGGASADHTHTFSGTTNGHSNDHTHTGTTNSGGVDHTHQYDASKNIGSALYGTNFSINSPGGVLTYTTGGASAYLHTHTFTSNGVSADHTHTYSGTTSGHSADHTHSIATQAAHTHTISSDGAHTHTFTSDATGGGALHTNMPPAIILNYIVKT